MLILMEMESLIMFRCVFCCFLAWIYDLLNVNLFFFFRDVSEKLRIIGLSIEI